MGANAYRKKRGIFMANEMHPGLTWRYFISVHNPFNAGRLIFYNSCNLKGSILESFTFACVFKLAC